MIQTYFTNWSLLFYIIIIILSKYLTISKIFFDTATCLVTTSSILGIPILLLNLNKFSNPKIILCMDIVFHWIPLFLVLIKYSSLSLQFNSKSNFILSLIIGFIFSIVYRKNYNPEKVYHWTNLKNREILLLGNIVFILSLIYLIN